MGQVDQAALVQFLLRMGNNTLVLGYRVSEWCGHAPILEEDIALANTALDLIGQTQFWLGLAGEVEGKGRDADQLAFLRDAWDFRNVLLVELPNGDFGRTMMRQFLFDAWASILLGRLMQSSDARVAAIAEKTSKEVAYHVERSAGTVVGLGDGTSECPIQNSRPRANWLNFPLICVATRSKCQHFSTQSALSEKNSSQFSLGLEF